MNNPTSCSPQKSSRPVLLVRRQRSSDSSAGGDSSVTSHDSLLGVMASSHSQQSHHKHHYRRSSSSRGGEEEPVRPQYHQPSYSSPSVLSSTTPSRRYLHPAPPPRMTSSSSSPGGGGGNSSSNSNNNFNHNSNSPSTTSYNKMTKFWIVVVSLLTFTNIYFLVRGSMMAIAPDNSHNNINTILSKKSSSSLRKGQGDNDNTDIDKRNPYYTKSDLVVLPAVTIVDDDGERTQTNNSRELFLRKDGLPSNETFGACLKIMDDNHWLVEWLAYHWFVMPLRHLVVYIDPKSQTSPMPILERWKPYINIHVMGRQYKPSVPYNGNPNIPGVLEHRGPHSLFIQDCMKIFRNNQYHDDEEVIGEVDAAEAEGKGEGDDNTEAEIGTGTESMKKKAPWSDWIAIIDTDEFIAVNSFMKDPSHKAIYRGSDSLDVIPTQDTPGSVMQLLKQEERRRTRLNITNDITYDKPNCRPMHRVQMCLEDEDGSGGIVASTVASSRELGGLYDNTVQPKDMLTQRQIFGDKGRQVKNMVNVKNLPNGYLQELNLLKDGNVHNPVPGHCPKLNHSAWEKGPYLERDQTLLQIYHYTGTKAQREFRDDVRGAFGKRTGTPVSEICRGMQPGDDVAPWIKGFVKLLGVKEAQRLLDGVGKTDIWPESESAKNTELQPKQEEPKPQSKDRCAIAFYGLPRAFQSLVLPSIIKNIIIPNAQYNCDYFVHYYHQKNEEAGRSGAGGTMNPFEVLLLRQYVLAAYNNITDKSTPALANGKPSIIVKKQEEEDFFRQHLGLIKKVRTTKDKKGRTLYFPWREKSYVFPTTTDNILKMWNTLHQAWELIMKQQQKYTTAYSRVAMLRIDVLYMTPIDIWDSGIMDKETGQMKKDVDNTHAVIPGFGRYPLSDRMIYGTADAVKVWASERFSRMEGHVQWYSVRDPGYGIHSERFVQNALLPNVQYKGIDIVEHPTLCFMRARADDSVWISDCGHHVLQKDGVSIPTILENLVPPLQHKTDSNGTVVVNATAADEHFDSKMRDAVERVTGRKCGGFTVVKDLHYESVDCSRSSNRTALKVIRNI